jgi:hypothetical protein
MQIILGIQSSLEEFIHDKSNNGLSFAKQLLIYTKTRFEPTLHYDLYDINDVRSTL